MLQMGEREGWVITRVKKYLEVVHLSRGICSRLELDWLVEVMENCKVQGLEKMLQLIHF